MSPCFLPIVPPFISGSSHGRRGSVEVWHTPPPPRRFPVPEVCHKKRKDKLPCRIRRFAPRTLNPRDSMTLTWNPLLHMLFHGPKTIPLVGLFVSADVSVLESLSKSTVRITANLNDFSWLLGSPATISILTLCFLSLPLTLASRPVPGFPSSLLYHVQPSLVSSSLSVMISLYFLLRLGEVPLPLNIFP